MDAMVAGNDSQGGYLVPEVQATEILKLATDGNPMRELATVKTISGDSYPFLVRGGKAGASWVGETAARPNTDTPTYSERSSTPFEIYANPPVSQTLLEDAAFDVETELNEAIAEEFAAQENTKFFTGSGTGEVQGLLSGATVDDASWVDGKIGVLNLLTACGLCASNGEARRLVQQGGVCVNDAKVTAPDAAFDQEDFEGDGVIIKKGKKVFHRACTK